MSNISKNNTFRPNSRQEGFTLVEILLALSIFTVAVVFFGSIYVYFTDVQTKTKSSQEILNEANHVLEVVAREIRNSVIYDYDIDASDCHDYVGTQYDNCILFKRPNGQLAAFASKNPDYSNSIYPDLLYIILDCGPVYTSDSCSWSETNYDAYTDLFLTPLNEIEVQDLNFYITPDTDPYFDESTNQHPKVTINMLVHYYAGKKIGQVSQMLQTTVSTRVFSR